MLRKIFFLLMVLLSLLVAGGCAPQSGTILPLPETGSTTEPEPGTLQAATPIEEQVLQALNTRDAAAIQALMGDSFMLGWWRGEISDYAPSDAVPVLLNNHLSSGAQIASAPQVDFQSFLGGLDPSTIPSPTVDLKKTLLVTGWGEDGEDEAILFLANAPDGRPYWHGALEIQGGFTSPETGGVQALNHETAGYSFYYPKGYEANNLPDGALVILAPPNTEGHRERLFIKVDEAGGKDVQQIADELRAEFPGFDIPATVMGIDGEQAIVLDKLPGQDLNRRLLIVHEGRLYSLMFVPDDAEKVEAHQQMKRLYATVINTFHFTPFSGSLDTNVDVEDFQAKLYQALSARDHSQMQAMMGPQFTIGYWLGEGVVLSPAQAVETLDFYLSSGTHLTIEEQANLPGLLNGTDPFSILQPGTNGVKAVLISGLGETGKDQGIAFIAKNEEGNLYWHGILLAKDGFSPRHTPETAQPTSVHETSVRYILAKSDVNVRSGPGLNYDVLFQIAGGQIAKVTGTSADGRWWRVICSDDSVGNCWVSADRALTESTEPPGSQSSPEQFEESLLNALRDHDFGSMRSLMAKNFMIAYWRSEGNITPSDDAIQELQQYHIGKNTRLSFERNRDLSRILDGNDAMSVLPPDVDEHKAIYVSGWGVDGQNDAILYTARTSKGELYWHGILVTADEFTQDPGTFPVVPTDVKWVMANLDLPMYSGPGSQYREISYVAGGMTAMVTGSSQDGKWWRVICPDDTVGDCWVTADPQRSQPVY